MSEYPKMVWVLMPSLKPKEIELFEASKYSKEHAYTRQEKVYHIGSCYPSREAALNKALEILVDQEADIAKRIANLEKRRKIVLKEVQTEA